MEKTIEAYEKWWNGELDRPLLPVIITGGETSKAKPKYWNDFRGGWCQPLFANTNVKPSEIIDCADYMFETSEHLGDSYPFFGLQISGAGVMAAFLGASLTVSENSIWFYSEKETELKDLHFEYNADNYWLNRLKELINEGKKRWGNDVVISFPDIGGVSDVLASFRGTEKLAIDLYDEPDEVARCLTELTELWHVYYNEFRDLFFEHGQTVNTNWAAILSKDPSYMFQSDFCYMIGTEMFDEFIKPELAEGCKRLPRGCYHLDGIGQLNHLDSLLGLKDLKLVQWIPGAGTTPVNHWLDVHEKILNAGKRLQIVDDENFTQLDKIIEKRGTAKGVTSLRRFFGKEKRDEALRLLDKYM